MSQAVMSRRQMWRINQQAWLVGQWYLPRQAFRIVDLACEWGWSGRSLRDAFPKTDIAGVDLHRPYLEHCLALRSEKGLQVYDELYEADVVDHVRELGHVEVIIAAEIVEHLEADKGAELLELCRQRSNLTVVTTPAGFHAQGALDGNELQVHRSGWTAEGLRVSGYTMAATMHMGFPCLVAYARRG